MRKLMHVRHLLALGLLGSGLLLATALPVAAADPVMLINSQTSKCLTIAGGVSTANNVEALQFTCDTHPSRRWRLIRFGNEFKIRNLQTGKCLTIAGGVSTENNVTALQFNCDDHPSRRWFINRVGNAFQIKNVQTGKCLTIPGGVSTANNVTALQFNCDSHPSRRWQVRSSVIFDD